MELVRCSSVEIKNEHLYKKTKNQMLLEDFLASDMDVAFVKNYPHKNAKSCYWSLKQSAKKFGIHGVDFMIRGQRVYIIRTDR